MEKFRRNAEESFRRKSMELPAEGIKVWKVSDDAFGVQASRAGVTLYRRRNGEIIMNLAQESRSPWVKNYENPLIKDGYAIRTAGYVDKKEDGIWNLYELLGTDKSGGYALGKKLDPRSPEYYKAWQDIAFFSGTMIVLDTLKDRDTIPVQGVKNLVEGGSVKFETLEHLLKTGTITKESFDVGVVWLRKYVVAQCADPRFDGFNSEAEMKDDPELAKLWTPVKESDLKKYFEKGYVDADLAKKCFEALRPKMRDVTGKDGFK